MNEQDKQIKRPDDPSETLKPEAPETSENLTDQDLAGCAGGAILDHRGTHNSEWTGTDCSRV